MKNPSYLALSRHNIYYFRWPLPLEIRQKGKTAHIKVSLQTREPREALRLAALLQVYAYNLLSQEWVLGMDYTQIKAMVQEHFAKILEERKRQIDKDGPLLPFPKAHVKRTIKHIQNKLDGSDEWNPLDYYDDNDRDIAAIVKKYELDLTNAERDRKKLKLLWKQGFLAMMQEVLAYSEIRWTTR